MKKKRWINAISTIFVVLFFFGSSLIIVVGNGSAVQSDEYTYTVSHGVATITGYIGEGGDITIPSTLDGYPVTTIRSFNGNTNITSIIISEGVEKLEGYVFCGCSMTSISIPSTVAFIGEGVFYGCQSLTTINVDNDNLNFMDVDGVLYTKDMSFLIAYPGGRQGSFAIPEGVEFIDVFAFTFCRSLESVTTPESMKCIYYAAFQYCPSLISITISSGVEFIDWCVFDGCRSLVMIDVNEDNENYASVEGVLYDKSMTTLICCPGGKEGHLTIPIGVQSIEEGAFIRCEKLTSVNIPSTVSVIGQSAFVYCTNLTEVIIPEGVTNIGPSAFGGCDALTIILIPSTVTSIEGEAFMGLSSLQAINVDEDNGHYTSIDGVLYDKALTTLIQCPGGKMGEIHVPAEVTSIGGSAFLWCYSLTAINVDSDNDHFSSVKGILYDATKTAVIRCPSGKTGIVVIPEGVVSIGDEAFEYCRGLTSVSIPSSVTTIGEMAFKMCKNLTAINFLGMNAPMTVDPSWIEWMNPAVLGHAYNTSDFPAPGDDFYGLTMGDFLEEPKKGRSDTILITAIVAVALVLLVSGTMILIRKNQGKK